MIPTIGIASEIGGNFTGSKEGPIVLKKKLDLDWRALIEQPQKWEDDYETLAKLNQQYAKEAELLVKESPFLGIGGDHSSAIGMWSGIAAASRQKGDIGLLWIDAHMDAHTPHTTPSGNIHGMPLAALLGFGDKRLTRISDPYPKVQPKNVALVGIRSYEKGELELLKSLNIRIFFMEEVRDRGLSAVLKEAIEIVTLDTASYGISFDLDSIDPGFVQAVGTPVHGGIDENEFLNFLPTFEERPPIAWELVEYNPHLDGDGRTFGFIKKFLKAIIPSFSLAKI